MTAPTPPPPTPTLKNFAQATEAAAALTAKAAWLSNRFAGEDPDLRYDATVSGRELADYKQAIADMSVHLTRLGSFIDHLDNADTD